MRLVAAASLMLAATTVAAARTDVLRDRRPFESGVEMTSVTATVRDADGHLVTGLPQDARLAVHRFLLELLDPTDQFFILAFNHQPHTLTPWTSSPVDVRRALEGVPPSGGTAVYDAVLAALPIVARRDRQRAALVVISDGADTASTATVREVHSALLRSDAFVYAIAIDSSERQTINARVNPAALREMTDDSGGRTEVVQSPADLMAATARIAAELNSQYVLGYTSPRGADGRYHSIRVRVQRPGYRVRARNGYVATPRRKG